MPDPACCVCGYALRGLPATRCPECGTPFTPGECARRIRPRLGLAAATLSVVATTYFLIHAVQWACGYPHASATVQIVHCGHALIHHNQHLAADFVLIPLLGWPLTAYARWGTAIARISLAVALIALLLCILFRPALAI